MVFGVSLRGRRDRTGSAATIERVARALARDREQLVRFAGELLQAAARGSPRSDRRRHSRSTTVLRSWSGRRAGWRAPPTGRPAAAPIGSVAWPTTLSSSVWTMAWLDVKSICGPAPGIVTSATRSARFSDADEAPRRLDRGLAAPGADVAGSIDQHDQPAAGRARVRVVLARLGRRASRRARSTEMNCAEAMRRGLPSTVSVKSSAVRSATGRPFLSMTLTSTGTRSTVDRNVGCGGGWSCGLRGCSPRRRPASSSASASAAARSPGIAQSLLRFARRQPVALPRADV